MDHKYCYQRERENTIPSFSSTLLDAIYRSIDETERREVEQDQLVLYKETMRKKQSNISSLKPNSGFRDEEAMANFQRACLIEKWMEKKVIVRRKSAADFQRKEERTDFDAASAFFNSSSSSSDSSYGGGFSSSEAESVYGVSSRTSCYGLNKPKPIRTSVSAQPEKSHKPEKDLNKYGQGFQPKPKQEGSFVKTKSRALKIYGDLKKVKQPISPGGRLASFLNSIFMAGNAKKAKLSSPNNNNNNTVGVYDDGINSERTLKSANASTCSSASSFSRSCLSKTPSSRGKSSNGMKRSVRFYPVSVIVDEDCQPCGQKSLYDDKPCMDLDTVKNIRSSINEELKFHVMEKNRRVEEAARDLLRNYQKKVECEFDLRSARINDQVFQNVEDDEDEDDEEDDDDAASYASSDLFELDNLSAIGMERYREELPVYETTHLGTNRAIANGLIL